MIGGGSCRRNLRRWPWRIDRLARLEFLKVALAGQLTTLWSPLLVRGRRGISDAQFTFGRNRMGSMRASPDQYAFAQRFMVGDTDG